MSAWGLDIHGQALGRSRGGFSTKIHLKTDLDGYAMAFPLTGEEESDSTNFEVLLDIGPDETPRLALLHNSSTIIALIVDQDSGTLQT